MNSKFWKRSLAFMAILFAALILVACGDSDDTPADDNGDDNGDEVIDAPETGDDEIVLNFAHWNDQVVQRFEEVVVLPDNVTINWIWAPNDDNVYQQELIRMLPAGELDLFVAEVDYIAQFTESDLVADVRDLGLTDADLSYMFQYTLDVATGPDGALRGVSWEANPGLFIYRRSIAYDVFGTDDPDVIQGYVQDWATFEASAAVLYEQGVRMVAGYADTYRTFSNNVTEPWVNEDNEIIIDPHMMSWVDQTYRFIDQGFAGVGVGLWSGEWSQGVNPGDTTPVFGYFHAPWGISFVMRDQSLDVQLADGGEEEVGNGTFGDWAAVPGPEGFFWGGTWIMAYSGSPHQELIADIMRQMTVDQDNLRTLSENFGDFVNNSAVVEDVANDPDFGSAFLGGQNHIALLADAVETIDMSHVGAFDQAITSAFQGAWGDYFEGIVTREEALDNFFETVTTFHPHLRRP
ncbi:MAG: ABC transporter substrate-binding protein [Turicibacter sp.]|nr:ABC transporter substrate-binding protein [Turicibacter sp.]